MYQTLTGIEIIQPSWLKYSISKLSCYIFRISLTSANANFPSDHALL